MQRRIAVVALVVVGVILVAAGPSVADHRYGRGSVELFIGGPPIVVAPPYGYRPTPYVVYPAPPVVYQRPPVVVAPPVVYEAPPVVPPPVWYYCQSYGAYYSNVPSCPEGWLLIPGR